MKQFCRLVKTHTFLTCLVLAIFTAVLVLGVYQLEQRQLESSLQSETEMLASVVAGSDDGAAQLERLALDRRVTLVNADGSVAFDNYASAATLENHGGREEIVQAHTSGEATVRRNSGTLAEEMVYHTKLLKNGQVLRLAAPQRTVWGLLSSFLPWVIGMLILAVLLAALLSARATKALIAPLTRSIPWTMRAMRSLRRFCVGCICSRRKACGKCPSSGCRRRSRRRCFPTCARAWWCWTGISGS